MPGIDTAYTERMRADRREFWKTAGILALAILGVLVVLVIGTILLDPIS